VTLHRSVLYRGRNYQVLFDVEGEHRDLVHLVDLDKPHDGLQNSDVIMTGARWVNGKVSLEGAEIYERRCPMVSEMILTAIVKDMLKQHRLAERRMMN
jgi:hypothetical protein